MQHIRPAFLIACLLTTLPAQLWAEAAPAQPGAIVLEGQSLPFLYRQSLSQIQVFAFHSAALTPIPFQIDERDRRGRWVIKSGPRPSRDDQPGRFDPNDAIIFLRRDMGQRAPAAAFPTGATRWHEVRLGSQDAALGFVYIRVGVKLVSAHSAQLSFATTHNTTMSMRNAIAWLLTRLYPATSLLWNRRASWARTSSRVLPLRLR